ncbi:MAG: hypothetical protein ABIN89_31370 [Chitinophagaceae bacterium]
MPKGFLTVFGKQVGMEIVHGNFKIFSTLKYYSKWKESLQPGKNSISDEQPWITFPVIALLNQYINSGTRVFEYGGGGSTLFFVNRVKEVITVEHDKEWFGILQNKINDKNTQNWTGNLVLPEKKNDLVHLNPSNPKDYFSNDGAFADSTFKSYASYIDKYPDEYFDIVLVDGRARPSCAWHSIAKLKKGGYLIIDNSDRVYYFSIINNTLEKEFELIYNDKDLSPYVDFLTQTGVWRKL